MTQVKLDVPAEIACLGIITASLNELIIAQPGLTEAELVSHNVQLAVHEVCMNIIEHAYADQPGGRIAVAMTIEPPPATASHLIIEIRDTGTRSFDPAAVIAPDLDEPQLGGYGLFLVEQLMDEVTYETIAGGHRWRLVKKLEQ